MYTFLKFLLSALLLFSADVVFGQEEKTAKTPPTPVVAPPADTLTANRLPEQQARETPFLGIETDSQFVSYISLPVLFPVLPARLSPTLPDSLPKLYPTRPSPKLSDSLRRGKRPKKIRKPAKPVAKIKKTLRPPSKAALLSTILPGLGQIYNRKIWKVPIIYGLFGVLAYTVNTYHKHYAEARDNLFFLTDKDPKTIVHPKFFYYTADNLRRRRDQMRRDRDYYLIISMLTYGLVVADAAVDGHLNRFDVSDDLSFRCRPTIIPLGRESYPGIPGLLVVFEF